MITAYAFIQPTASPADAKTALEATLADTGVTGATVTLQRVDVAGYAFRIEAPDDGDNFGLLQSLCGTLNTVSAQAAPAMAMRAMQGSGQVGELAEPWRVAGGEGRFAAEHPPPEWAK